MINMLPAGKSQFEGIRAGLNVFLKLLGGRVLEGKAER